MPSQTVLLDNAALLSGLRRVFDRGRTRWGFEAMSHRRAVLAKRARPDLKVVYPPYSEKAVKILKHCLTHGT
jgi:hypothetical protein